MPFKYEGFPAGADSNKVKGAAGGTIDHVYGRDEALDGFFALALLKS